MKKYGIKVYYQTGDSFSSYEQEDMVELDWDNLDKAEEALNRIEEHYHWYEDVHNSYRLHPKRVEEPAWHKGIKYDFTLVIPNDDGEPYQFIAPWCGYFESLHSAEIVEQKEQLPRRYFKY